jgi:fumarate hydratase subunit alpha
MSVVFVELGQEVHITGSGITDAINEGVRQAYRDGYLRKSVVGDPLNRKNTGDNTPAVIHYDIVPGDKIRIQVMPKGFGSENMSAIKMLKPSDGVEGVIDFVLEAVCNAGSNPCPPIIVGVGIGGTMEKAAILSKKSLLRSLNEKNTNSYYADLEALLLNRINNLGIGPQGLGGITTALGVRIESYPTHIAGLPVAVNITCHAARHTEIIL